MRRATANQQLANTQTTFQSTLSMRRATHSYTFSKTFHNISIHALHEESDDNTPSNDSFNDVISIHALHEESD